MNTGITVTNFGSVDGHNASLITATSGGGSTIKVTTYGARIVALELQHPCRGGKGAAEKTDVVLGYETLDEYRNDGPYFGAVVGRVANRVFSPFTYRGRDGEQVTVSPPLSDPPRCSLHGGARGLSNVVWEYLAGDVAANGDVTLRLRYLSPEGEEGYHGALTTTVSYTLTADNALVIAYRATVAGASSPVVLTNHTYFNLKGQGRGTVADHLLEVRAAAVAEKDQWNVTTGRLLDLALLPQMDFRAPKLIGTSIDDASVPTLTASRGYDHFYVADKQGCAAPFRDTDARLCCTLSCPSAPIVMRMFTTEAGLQLYTGNWIAEDTAGKHGARYGARGGVALEASSLPGSVHHSEWEQPILSPGEVYSQTTVYQFQFKE